MTTDGLGGKRIYRYMPSREEHVQFEGKEQGHLIIMGPCAAAKVSSGLMLFPVLVL